MEVSDTPRTDEVVRNCETASRETQRIEYLAHARQLERELAQMTHLAHKFDNETARLSEVCHDVNRDLARERRRVAVLVDALCEGGMYRGDKFPKSDWRDRILFRTTCRENEVTLNIAGIRHNADGKLEGIK